MQDGTSFGADIRPLFTSGDLKCMSAQGVDLGNYEYMSDPASNGIFQDHANARHVLARLTGTETPQMPLGAPHWSAVMLQRYQNWIDQGFLP